VERRLAQIDESVARYLSQLDTADLQEPSEAVDPLLDQSLALAMQPPGVLLLDIRNLNHTARIRLAAQIAAERPQYAFDVDPVGLGPLSLAGSPAGLWVDNIIAYPMLCETAAVQPEPVVAGLVARDHLDWPTQIALNLLA